MKTMRKKLTKLLCIIVTLTIVLPYVYVSADTLQVGDPLYYGEELYNQDFSGSESVSDLFSQTSGIKFVTEGAGRALQFTGGTGVLAFLKDKSAWSGESEYIMSADFKINSTGLGGSGSSAGIAFGTDAANFYHPRLDRVTATPQYNRIQLIAWFNGTAEPAAQRPELAYPFAFDTSYKMSAVVRGKTIDIYIDDMYCLSKTYANDIPNSLLGFRAYGCTAVVTNMSVHKTSSGGIPETLTARLSKTSEVAVNSEVDVIFGSQVEPSTIDGISLKKGGASVSANISVASKDPSGKTVTVSPQATLSYDSTYTVEINSTVKDVYENTVKNPPLSLSFTTAPEFDPTEPPQPGDMLYYGEELYNQDFSGSEQVSDLFSQTAGLSFTTSAGVRALQIVGGEGRLTFLKDKTPWAAEGEYIVSADFIMNSAGLGGNGYSAGIAIGTDTSNYYHPRLDSGPTIALRHRAQLIAWFNGTAEAAADRPDVSYPFLLGTKYKVSAVVRGKTIDLYVDDQFVISKTYLNNIPNGLVGFRAFGCTTVVTNIAVHKTSGATIPDTLNASLSKTTGVAANSDIEVVFRTPVEPSTIEGITLKKGGAAVAATVKVSSNDSTGRTVVITPSALLSFDTAYTVEINGNVKDIYDNTVKNPPLILPFTTAKADNPIDPDERLRYGTLLYNQDFSGTESLSDLFTKTAGLSFIPASGGRILQSVGGEGNLALLKNKTQWAGESEYIVSATLKINSADLGIAGYSAGIAVGTDDKNYYHPRLDSGPTAALRHRAQLISWFNGTAEGAADRPDVSYPFLFDTPYKLSAVVSGNTIAFYVDDQYCVSKTYANAIPNGYIGIRTFGCTAEITNLSVYKTAGTIIPTDPLTAALSQTTGVMPDGEIDVLFNSTIEGDTIGGISLKQNNTSVEADLRVSAKDAKGKTVTITPSSLLIPGTEYTVEINSGVKDIYGNAVETAPLILSFTTMAATPSLPPLETEHGNIMVRLNGDWKFKTDPSGVGSAQNWQGTYAPEWGNITVPGNWNTLNEYANYSGTGWYVRTFTVPTAQQDYPAYLRVERAYHDATVYINGEKAGEHNGGYTEFEFRVDHLLNYGGENIIAISVDNTYGWGVNTIAKGDSANGAWYKWGGISGNVSLVTHNTARFIRQKVTPVVDLRDKSGTVNIEYLLTNAEFAEKAYTIKTEIYDKASGTLVETTSKSVVLPRMAEAAVLADTVSLSSVKLWDYDHPNLYTVKTILLDGDNTAIDTLSDNIGFRKFELTETKALLNGKPIRASGANRVGDNRAYGQTEPLHVIMRDIDYMKSMGMNMARLSHYPMDKELLDYCDEIGFMLICEGSVWGDQNPNVFGENKAQNWYREMINKDYNHPSIIAWSLGNEIRGQYQQTVNYVTYMKNLIMSLDPTRYVTEPSNTAMSSPSDSVRLSDFVSRNSYGSFSSTAATLYDTFRKPIYFSEYGLTQNSEPLDSSSINFQTMMDGMSTTEAVFGGAVWTLNDYRSIFEGTGTTQNRIWGVTTVWGDKKGSFQQLRDASTPVKSLDVKINGNTNNAGNAITAEASMEIKPSNMIPSYAMYGYKLKVEMRDKTGAIAGGQAVDLPDIEPDASGYFGHYIIPLTVPQDGIMYVRASIVSPIGYEISETTKYFSAPLEAPVIKDIAVTANGARVSFSHVEGATSYTVSYGSISLSSSKNAIMNNYVDITGLTSGIQYQFRVAAVNSAGQTLSEIKYATPTGASAFPPKIMHVEPVAGGFYIGYTGEGWTSLPSGTGWTPEQISAQNVYYEVQYGVAPGTYNSTRTGIKTQGAYLVDGLANGQTYYSRIRYVKDGVASAWSEEVTVKTESPNQTPDMPQLLGGVPGNDCVSLTFNPVWKATGYVVKYGTSPSSMTSTLNVNRSHVNQAIVSGLAKDQTYYFAIAAQNDGVISDFTAPVAVTVNASEIQDVPWADVKTNELTFVSTQNVQQIEIGLSTSRENGSTVTIGFKNVPNGVTVSETTIPLTSGEYTTTTVPVTVNTSMPDGKYPIIVTVSSDGMLITQKAVILNIAGSKLLMYEPFNSYNSSDWTIVGSASPSVVNGEMRIPQMGGSSANAVMITGESSWSNYTVEGDITYNLSNPNNSGGLVFRYSDNGTFYHFRLNNDPDVLFQIYAFKPSAELLYSEPAGVSTSGTIHYKIVNYGDTAEFYANGKFITKLTGLALGNGSGKVGYRVYGSTTLIVDNLIVYENLNGMFTADANIERSGNDANMTVDVANTTGEDTGIVVYAALYDEFDKLLSVQLAESLIGTSDSFDFTFDLEDVPDGYYFKVFTWHSMTNMPLIDAIDL